MGFIRMLLGFVGLSSGGAGLYALVFMAGVAGVIAIFVAGMNYANKDDQIATLTNERDAARMDLTNIIEAQKDSAATAIVLDAEKKKDEDRSKETEKNVSTLPVDQQFIVTDDIVRGMRGQKPRRGTAPARPAVKPVIR